MAEPETQSGPPQRRRPPKGTAPLPHNLDAEGSILGGIILRNEALAELETLEIAAFYSHKNQVVFEAMRNLEFARKPIDVVTLEAEIEKSGKLDAIGGIAYLGELALLVPTSENVVAYSKIVRDLHLLREIALKTSRAVERVQAGWDYEPDELLGETIADLQQLERGYREQNEKLPIITIEQSLDEIDRLARTPIFETPFPEMDRSLGFGGFLGGQVYYLCGGTGFGKTSWLATIVRHHALAGRPALIAFWEMFSGYYTARMVAAVLGVPATQILRGQIARSRILDVMPKSIEMLDTPSMATLKRAAERQVRLGNGAPLIVVDYVQLLGERIFATMTRPDARLAVAMASGGLRELAKETGAAVIAVSAAGRSASKELAKDVRKRPARDLIASSRESGSIEFDGAGMIVLSVSDEKDGDEDIATISVAKARFGETRHIDGRYDGRTGAWREIGLVVRATKLDPKPDDGSVRAEILEQLGKEPAKSKTALAKRCRKNKTAVLSEWDLMLDEGLIVARDGMFKAAGIELEAAIQETQQALLPEEG